MSDKENFSITNKTRMKIPVVPFTKIKNEALGEKYDLSLVFIGEDRSRYLNRTYRGKNKPTNVLSFEIEKNQGEVFITPKLVRKETKLFDRKFDNLVAFLFIHGLMHLKGMEHGSTMEKAEVKLRKKFKI